MTPLPPETDDSFRVFALDSLERDRGDQRWYEFHRSRTQYAGLYVLPRGAVDDQTPHDHDELYVVQRGRAIVLLGTERTRQVVGPGSVIYVKAGVEHRFCEIEDDLHLLVFFSIAGPG